MVESSSEFWKYFCAERNKILESMKFFRLIRRLFGCKAKVINVCSRDAQEKNKKKEKEKEEEGGGGGKKQPVSSLKKGESREYRATVWKIKALYERSARDDNFSKGFSRAAFPFRLVAVRFAEEAKGKKVERWRRQVKHSHLPAHSIYPRKLSNSFFPPSLSLPLSYHFLPLFVPWLPTRFF